MSKFKKLFAGSVIALLFTAGMTIAGTTAANAAGDCTSYGINSGNMTPTCRGTVQIRWKCSSDLFGTENSKSLTYGAGYSSNQTFRACNVGNPVNYYYVSV